MKSKPYHLCSVKQLQTFFLKMAIEDQRIHQNRKTNNQNRPTNNLTVYEYDGETLSHDKANVKTRKVHIISGLDIFSKKEFNMKEKT